MCRALKIFLRRPNDTSLYILLLFKLVMLPLLVTSALGSLAGFIRCKYELLILVILPSQTGPLLISPTLIHGSFIYIVAHTRQSSVLDWVIALNCFFLPFCEIIHLHPLPRDFALTFSREGGIYLLLCPFDVGFGQ